MSDTHITRELLRAVARGELPPRFLVQVGAEHLASICPHCREELEAWKKERASGGKDYSQIFEILPRVIEIEVPRMERAHQSALRDLKALLALAPERRLDRVKNARSRFRGTELAELLLEESEKLLRSTPHAALHLAKLARTVVHHSPAAPGDFDLIALATACMANASRVAGELRAAAGRFRHARYVVSHEGVTDPEVLARIDDLEASLRKDQRQFVLAEELLSRASVLYRLAGATFASLRVRIKLADVFFHQGAVEKALETLRPALQRLHREKDPRLFLCARYNLALYLVELHQYRAAEEVLASEKDLFERFAEPWTRLRVTWLTGKIALGRGRLAAAERCFLEAREGFIREGIGYDAAMVSVEDLALLYLREGRLEDVKRLAEEIVPIFEAGDVHREALAALMLFQEAARRKSLTAKPTREEPAT
jgi:tetratricopeptide (TPR) repeat protein